MENADYIVLAIPVFFGLIALELVVARALERDYYSLADSLNDLSCGIIQQLVEVFAKTALFAGYVTLSCWSWLRSRLPR